MKKQVLAIVITTILCFGALSFAFNAFLTYSQNEYKKNHTQSEQVGEYEANNIDVSVNLAEDEREDDELHLEMPTPSPGNIIAPDETIDSSETLDSTTQDDTNTGNPATDTAQNSPDSDTIHNEPVTTPETANVNQPSGSNGHIVAIDAGHQQKGNSEKEPLGPGSSEMKAKVSSGTTGKYTGVAEYVVNLDVALLLRDELKNRGYQVVMIRESHDVNISNSERAAIANNSGAEIFIRIHCNGVDNSSVKGALTMAPTSSNPYVGGMASECNRLSQIIVDEYCAATGFQNKGIQYYDNMSGINWCKIPVTIIEMGFMTNPEDDFMLTDPSMQKKMAVGMANGIDKYFGL